MASLNIPATATFRRAEGLSFRINLCEGIDRFQVFAQRQAGETESMISAQEAEVLSRLSRWQTARELGVQLSTLISLVERNCLFWSTGRPDRNLTGAPLKPLEGKVALRPNVQVRALVTTSEGTDQLEHMPRRGSLDRALLGGITLPTWEMNCTMAWTSVQCCPKHAAIARDIVPLLDGRHDVAQIASTPSHRAFLQALAMLGLLERYTPRQWDGKKPRVTWLVHAGVLYEAAGKRILIDPVWWDLSEPSRLKDRPFDPRDVGDIDAVLITHGDNDHLNPNTLTRLPRDTPIVIPSTLRAEEYQVDMFQLLATIGCRRIIEVDEWQRIKFGDVAVVAVPFRGEDWGLNLACRTYLVSSPELTIYCNADSTSTPEVYEDLAKEFKIDVAFVGVTGAAESYVMPPGFGYGNFYSQWVPEARHNEWVQLCNGPKDSVEAANLLKARYAFGYAAGGADFCEIAYCDRGTHGEFARRLVESGGPAKPLDLPIGVPTVVPDP